MDRKTQITLLILIVVVVAAVICVVIAHIIIRPNRRLHAALNYVTNGVAVAQQIPFPTGNSMWTDDETGDMIAICHESGRISGRHSEHDYITDGVYYMETGRIAFTMRSTLYLGIVQYCVYQGVVTMQILSHDFSWLLTRMPDAPAAPAAPADATVAIVAA